MEEVTSRENLNRAYRKVRANKGAPGVDGVTLDDLPAWIAEHKQELIDSLLAGSYQPQAVRGVQIPKPGGGVRQLGIPTVVDRLVQQAILHVLEPRLDPTFADSSYGFRPGKSAHQALTQASRYVAEGRTIVVDMDLEKFFDRVNRDKSAVATVSERKFLGYRLLTDGRLTIAPQSLQRAKDRVRQITRRNRGVNFERMISELNSFTTGWVTYFRLAAGKSPFGKLDGWIRRKLRCVRLKQRKRAKSIAAFLQTLGVSGNQSWTTAACGKGWWRMSGTPSAHHGMNNHWFQTQGYHSLEIRYLS